MKLLGETLMRTNPFRKCAKIYKIHSRKIYVRVKCPFPLFLEEHASNMRNSLKYFSLRCERRNVFFLLLCNIRPAYIVYVLLVSRSSRRKTVHTIQEKKLLAVVLWVAASSPPWIQQQVEEEEDIEEHSPDHKRGSVDQLTQNTLHL